MPLGTDATPSSASTGNEVAGLSLRCLHALRIVQSTYEPCEQQSANQKASVQHHLEWESASQGMKADPFE